MDLPLNQNQPSIMHIDLNSCFATAEQQANPLLRGKVVAVAAYPSPGGCIISPSIEAKKLGIKVGMRVKEARLIYKNIVVLAPDPPKYRDIHLRFKKIFKRYSNKVIPQSIDEAVIDFKETLDFYPNLIAVAKTIKKQIKKEIGEWISCSIGISTNRFLAKLAASLHKPDGLEIITHKNLINVYKRVKLVDLNGINTRFQARLNAWGIFTPLHFLQAPLILLKKQVFKSICGYYWYLRLRGWEIDAVNFARQSYGQSYALPQPTNNTKKLTKILMKLCEKMGRRLRKANCMAKTIHLSCLYSDRSHWHQGKTVIMPLYAT